MIHESSTVSGTGVPITQDILPIDWRIEEQSQMMMQLNQYISQSMQQQQQTLPPSQAQAEPQQQQLSIRFQQQEVQDAQLHQHAVLWQQQNLQQQQQQQQMPAMTYELNGNSSAQLTSGTADIYNFSFEYAPQSVTNSDASILEIANISDKSTGEEANTEADILPNNDQFAYLQGLNSDNLMQFSQQSAIQDLMIKDQLEEKPLNLLVRQNLNVLPTLEEHDIGGYKFQLNLTSAVQQQRKNRSNWVYSEALNKVYLRMNDLFTIDAQYTPKSPQMPLRIRALLSFVKSVSEPVLRCQNHISKDNELQMKKRHSLLRCENPSTEYCGSDEGKCINDRYSVMIPLSMGLKPNAVDNTIKQTIALKFTCQNSCIGRKDTSIIFLLEGANGEILSQRVLNVKICSCPKRDKAGDERNVSSTKRKMDEDLYEREPKIQRQNASLSMHSPASSVSPISPISPSQERSGSDLEDASRDSNPPKRYDVQRTSSGGYRVVMELSSREELLNSIEGALNTAAAKMVLEPQHSARFQRSFRKLRRLQEKAIAMSLRSCACRLIDPPT